MRKTRLIAVSIGLWALSLFVSVIAVQVSAEEDYSLIASLQSPEPDSDAWFGSSVAISGDILVVGERLGKVEDYYAGKAHLFDLEGNLKSTLQSPILPPVRFYCPNFGGSVAVSGDIVIVGERNQMVEDIEDAGKAYIFDSDGNLKSTLQSPTPDVHSLFGYSVSVSGGTIVIGEPFNDVEDIYYAGRAYRFDSDGNLQSNLQSPTPDTRAFFGCSVAADGDIIVIGEVYVAAGQAPVGPGSTYVFDSEGNFLTTLKSPEQEASTNFGWSVAISENIIVVGESLAEVDGKIGAGRAYIFDTDGNLLTTLQALTPEENAEFGNAVAISGDTVVVAEYKADVEVINEGRVYVFDLNGNLQATLVAHTPGINARFGHAVATNGEIVVVGEPGAEADGEIKAGKVHVYQAGAAAFTSSGLTIDPSSVDIGGKVTISVEVANTGGKSGTHTVALKVDGEVEDEKTVTLNPEETKTVSFEVSASKLGTFSVEIGGLSGSYTVSEPEEEKTGFVIPGFPHESMIIGLVLGAFVLWLIQSRR